MSNQAETIGHAFSESVNPEPISTPMAVSEVSHANTVTERASESDGSIERDVSVKRMLDGVDDDPINYSKRLRINTDVGNGEISITDDSMARIVTTASFQPTHTIDSVMVSQPGPEFIPETQPPCNTAGKPYQLPASLVSPSFINLSPQQQAGFLHDPMFAAATAQAIQLSHAGVQYPGNLLRGPSSFPSTYLDARSPPTHQGRDTGTSVSYRPTPSDANGQQMAASIDITDLRNFALSGGVGIGAFNLANPFAMYIPMSAAYLPPPLFGGSNLQVPINVGVNPIVLSSFLGQAGASSTQKSTPPTLQEHAQQHFPSGAATDGASLYMPMDEDVLAENQILIRKQIEFFAAGVEDVETITSGRRRPIALGQVGIRCRHCAHLPLRHRKKAAIYYPTRLKGIYQAAQNMNASHLADACLNVDHSIKVQLVAFQQNKSTTGHGGKEYWSQTALAQGVIELEGEGLRYKGGGPITTVDTKISTHLSDGGS